jgi:hypothetical protein
MKLARLLFGLGCAALCLCAEPVKVDPANPHYYSFHGRPVLLITSAEHYGAVINLEFNYVAYLDALQAAGLNYTRIYPGYMFEPVGKYMPGNTLGVRPAYLQLPWARSTTPGYMLGGNKFDLDRWDDAYFERFKDFLHKADERGIVVEICFFNSQYSDTWPISPLYHENNIQNVGFGDWRAAQSLKEATLVSREEDYVRKLTEQANSFDNVILEVCDEAASIGTGISLAGQWVAHMADVVLATEKKLRQKHLLAQEVEGPFGGAMDHSTDRRFDIIVGQFTYGGIPGEAGGEMGGIQGLDRMYGLNKPIEFNETNYYPLNYRGDEIADSRVEAWEFIVGGGAGFNQLNGLFTAEDPAGTHPDNKKLFAGLRHLREFMSGFEFTKMHPDKPFIIAGPDKTAYYRVLSEPSRQYAIYIHHSAKRKIGSYEVVPGNYAESLAVTLPAGRYQAEWVDPSSGKVTGSETIAHAGGTYILQAPRYSMDIALRIRAAR